MLIAIVYGYSHSCEHFQCKTKCGCCGVVAIIGSLCIAARFAETSLRSRRREGIGRKGKAFLPPLAMLVDVSLFFIIIIIFILSLFTSLFC